MRIFSLLPNGMRDRLLAIEGVSEVVPGMVGFSAWGPLGAMTSVIVVGTDVTVHGLSPWNVVEGTAQSLTTPGTVVVDRAYSDQLGVSGAGVTAQIRGQPVTVGAVTDGVRSFTTTPYVFADLDDARAYIGLPPTYQSFSCSLKPAAESNGPPELLSNIPSIQALTPDQFDSKARRSGFSEQAPAPLSLRAHCSA